MKKIALSIAGLVIVLGAGAWLLFANLDHIIKSAVEKYASAATQATVSLDSVKLSPTTGVGTLSGLSIGNPQGFSTPQAFYLGSIGVKIDIASIKGNGPIVIREITIDKPQVTYELLNSGNSNLQTIQRNAQTYASSLQGETAATQDSASAPKDSAGNGNKSASTRKIIIDNLIIRNGQIAISQELLKGKQLRVPLPEIHLTNIGRNDGGATPAQVADAIFGAITTSASQAAVTELAKDKLGGLINAVPASSIGKAAIGTVGDTVKGFLGQ